MMNKYPENDWRNYFIHSDESMKYGLPEKKKYPMPDSDHVMSAIRFFNYVSPSDEKELARNIIARIKEYGITGINVGKNNRFGKYYKPEQYLQHHGIKGQKWGVQNGPPYPLDTPRNRAIKTARTKSKVDSIVDSLTDDERDKLAISKGESYLTIEEGEHVIYRALKEVGDIPIAFFDALDDGDTIQLAMATRSGDEYRGKGYATKVAKQCMRYLEKHPKKRAGRDIIWGVRADNVGSIKIAKKLGFVEDPDSYNDGWVNYVNRA